MTSVVPSTSAGPAGPPACTFPRAVAALWYGSQHGVCCSSWGLPARQGVSTTSGLLDGLPPGSRRAIITESGSTHDDCLPASSSLLPHLGDVAGDVAVALLDAPGHIQRHVWGDSLPTLPADCLVCCTGIRGAFCTMPPNALPSASVRQAACQGRLRNAVVLWSERHESLCCTRTWSCCCARLQLAQPGSLKPQAPGTHTPDWCSQLQKRPVRPLLP